jgi:hypothetical protein
MRPYGLKLIGKKCFARYAQIGRCARDADIQKPEEQAGNALGQAVDADKEDRLERRPLTQKGDATLVAKCPWRVGIVSTGLIVNGDDEGERGALAKI